MNPTSSSRLLHPSPQRKYVLVTYFSDNLSSKMYFLKSYSQKWGLKWQNECIFHTHQLLVSNIAPTPPHHLYIVRICSRGLLVSFHCNFLHPYPLLPLFAITRRESIPHMHPSVSDMSPAFQYHFPRFQTPSIYSYWLFLLLLCLFSPVFTVFDCVPYMHVLTDFPALFYHCCSTLCYIK